MFNKLYKLIFGLDEFTKTKIELRFELAQEILDKLEVNSIEDFDLLESCIYKIKDQLRVKSSNLNNVIRDKEKNLDKQKVDSFLNELLELRSTFLNTAFTAIKKHKEIQDTIQEEPSTLPAQSTPLTFSTHTYTLTLTTEGGLNVEVDFKSEVDYKILRIISSIIFDETKSQGTTIIVEENKAYIIPRKLDDNILLPLPQRENKEEVEKAFKALTNNTTEDNYLKNVEKKPEFISKYNDEESLDNLISNYDKNAKNYPHHKEKDDQNIEFEKDDPITLEKKEKVPEEFTVEKKTPEEQNFVFYEDEEIKAYCNSNSAIFGEIIVEPMSKKAINQLDESQFSYIFLFSKIFASTLFDVLQAHGTTMLWQQNDSGIRIIPRYKDDNAIPQWSALTMDNTTLDDIQHQLLSRLSEEVGTQQNNSSEGNSKKEEKTLQKEEPTRQRAKFLLDELRKIP